MASRGVLAQESQLAAALKSISGTSEVALWPCLGNCCREDGVGREAASGQGGGRVSTGPAPLLPVSAIGKGSHLLLSATELEERKNIPDMLGQVRAGCLASQLGLHPQLLYGWFCKRFAQARQGNPSLCLC